MYTVLGENIICGTVGENGIFSMASMFKLSSVHSIFQLSLAKSPPCGPTHTCKDYAVNLPNVFYDGSHIFHFRLVNVRWYYAFVHHDHLMPYFYS